MKGNSRKTALRIASTALAIGLALASCSNSSSPPSEPPAPAFGMYVAGYFSEISAYSVDETTGAPSLLSGSPFATGYQAFDIALAPDKPYLYLVCQGTRSVFAHRIESDGSLTAIDSGVDDLGDPPIALAISHDGEYLYATVNNGTIEAYGIGDDGKLSSIGQYGTESYPSSAAISPDDKYLYIANYSAHYISAYAIGENGSLSPIPSGPLSVGYSPWDIVISADGTYLYVSNRGATAGGDGISLYRIGSEGALEDLDSYDTGAEPTGLTLSPDGAYLYAANYGASDGVDGLSAYRIGTDGGLSAIGSYAAGSGPCRVAVAPKGNFVYVINQSSTGADGLSAYGVGTDGTLNSIGTYATDLCPFAIAIVD
jgi:6-phosphogluconolactonase (cycloisomerase 2 family)